MNRRVVSQAPRQRPLLLVRLQQDARMQRRYVAQLPWWRHPFVGYSISMPLTALGLLLPLGERYFTGHTNFLGTSSFLVTVVIALFWGSGPAVFSILLGLLALDYFFMPPYNQFTIESWRQALPLAPFFVGELIVALITAQRELARRRALFAEQEIQAHADQLEEINSQLRQTNQIKDVFFSRASHELKTPLTTIRGQSQLALRRLAKVPKSSEIEQVRDALEKIEDQTRRLHALIDDLLDIGMLSAGKIKLRLKRCNVGDICREVVEDQRALSGRTIDLELPRTAVVLRSADCERLTQVLINLITNAIKYSAEGSRVCVRVLPQNARVTIEIHNEGTPIPQEQQENIFEPFYRAGNAQSSSKQGWGLGLAICKDIIERHNGHIRVSSTPQEGTTFCVELPTN